MAVYSLVNISGQDANSNKRLAALLTVLLTLQTILAIILIIRGLRQLSGRPKPKGLSVSLYDDASLYIF